MKNKLIHSGVDWKKVCMSQSKKWASKSGPVVITKKGNKSKSKKEIDE
jgi:hypothetical protein